VGVSFNDKSEPKLERTKTPAPTLGSTPCPECGVMVAKGYVVCPKCQTAMPSAKSPLAKQLGKSGGTTVMTPARTGAWTFVLLCAVGTAAIWFMAQRSSSEKGAPIERDDTLIGAMGDGGAAEVETETEPPAPVANPEERKAALDAVETKLADVTLWSWVDIDDDEQSVLELRSTHCGDDQVMITVNEASAELEKIGIDTVRCIARHGVIEWDKPLDAGSE
jgi:hypothetical protein